MPVHCMTVGHFIVASVRPCYLLELVLWLNYSCATCL